MVEEEEGVEEEEKEEGVEEEEEEEEEGARGAGLVRLDTMRRMCPCPGRRTLGSDNGWPAMKISPDVGEMSPVSTLSVELLPAPLMPRKPKRSPAGHPSVRPRTACLALPPRNDGGYTCAIASVTAGSY